MFNSVAPPGFCNRGEVRYGSIGGLEYKVPQKLTHLLHCTHTNPFNSPFPGLLLRQCTHILHNFWTSTHRGEASPSGGATHVMSIFCLDCCQLIYWARSLLATACDVLRLQYVTDVELGHWVTGSVGHLGHLSRPGHRVIILTRCETRVFPVFEKMPTLQNVHLKCWNDKSYCQVSVVGLRSLDAAHAMNFYFYLWLLKILWPENTSSHKSTFAFCICISL